MLSKMLPRVLVAADIWRAAIILFLESVTHRQFDLRRQHGTGNALSDSEGEQSVNISIY